MDSRLGFRHGARLIPQTDSGSVILYSLFPTRRLILLTGQVLGSLLTYKGLRTLGHFQDFFFYFKSFGKILYLILDNPPIRNSLPPALFSKKPSRGRRLTFNPVHAVVIDENSCKMGYRLCMHFPVKFLSKQATRKRRSFERNFQYYVG